MAHRGTKEDFQRLAESFEKDESLQIPGKVFDLHNHSSFLWTSNPFTKMLGFRDGSTTKAPWSIWLPLHGVYHSSPIIHRLEGKFIYMETMPLSSLSYMPRIKTSLFRRKEEEKEKCCWKYTDGQVNYSEDLIFTQRVMGLFEKWSLFFKFLFYFSVTAGKIVFILFKMSIPLSSLYGSFLSCNVWLK